MATSLYRPHRCPCCRHGCRYSCCRCLRRLRHDCCCRCCHRHLAYHRGLGACAPPLTGAPSHRHLLEDQAHLAAAESSPRLGRLEDRCLCLPRCWYEWWWWRWWIQRRCLPAQMGAKTFDIMSHRNCTQLSAQIAHSKLSAQIPESRVRPRERGHRWCASTLTRIGGGGGGEGSGEQWRSTTTHQCVVLSREIVMSHSDESYSTVCRPLSRGDIRWPSATYIACAAWSARARACACTACCWAKARCCAAKTWCCCCCSAETTA